MEPLGPVKRREARLDRLDSLLPPRVQLAICEMVPVAHGSGGEGNGARRIISFEPDGIRIGSGKLSYLSPA